MPTHRETIPLCKQAGDLVLASSKRKGACARVLARTFGRDLEAKDSAAKLRQLMIDTHVAGRSGQGLPTCSGWTLVQATWQGLCCTTQGKLRPKLAEKDLFTDAHLVAFLDEDARNGLRALVRGGWQALFELLTPREQ
jgi:hypothetical protein